MPKTIATLRNFSGGINNQYSPRDIQDNEFPYATDIVADRIGVIRTMGNGEGTPKQIADYSSNKSINTLSTTDISSSTGYGFKHFELDWNEAAVIQVNIILLLLMRAEN